MPESLEANLEAVRRTIGRSAARVERDPADVRLVAVNVAEEPKKTGVLPADLRTVAAAVNAAQHLRLRGLMTVAPMVADPETVRPVFKRLRAFRDQTSQQVGTALPVLSMGMTDD